MTLAGLALAVALTANPAAPPPQPPQPQPQPQQQPVPPAHHLQAPPPAVPAVPAPPQAPAAPQLPPPASAAIAIERARAAYEYGDMEMVVESARLVSDGRLSPTPAEREQALRYLGIGLFVTGRAEGAETAFFDLLRLRPNTRLDPTTTRPDCVAFFEEVRRRHAAEIREAARNRPGKKSYALAFIPVLAQFQNGQKGKGITFAAVGVISLAAAIATNVQLHAWETPDHTFGTHADDASTLKTINWISVGVFVATMAIGIVDGVANFPDDGDEPSAKMATKTPARLDGLGFRF